MYVTININYIKHHYNVCYMYVHSILHVFTWVWWCSFYSFVLMMLSSPDSEKSVRLISTLFTVLHLNCIGWVLCFSSWRIYNMGGVKFMFLIFDIPAKVLDPCWIKAESTSSPERIVIWQLTYQFCYHVCFLDIWNVIEWQLAMVIFHFHFVTKDSDYSEINFIFQHEGFTCMIPYKNKITQLPGQFSVQWLSVSNLQFECTMSCQLKIDNLTLINIRHYFWDQESNLQFPCTCILVPWCVRCL